MMLHELKEKQCEPLALGSDVFLIRKLSGHVVETKLTAIGTGVKPSVEVTWKNRIEYKLDLTDNQVLAHDQPMKHREEMRLRYEIYEPQRKELIKLFESTNSKRKKGLK